ncbi:ADP-ribosylglycohydrolase family protein [Rhodococcus opacus]|uniref:ADP-ribosylglycohydrolase family protein n=1 Tax=Rhodococcus opacus TaxID=37919 RepID=UPI00146B4946|nr:ADP-ribosylglycohydrolase family protein [Rhodococcus opacus]MDV7088190.1 ADP-ribosylglycohydrolase family protein [Rhodococcus opacus]WKN52559.1 ADP-ribosylglycohydrolase family protein [Rhodococcus opacus]
MTAPTAGSDTALLARYANALIGLAAGDAWGYQVEFTSYAQMPAYPVAPPSGRWWVSDDTQMTLALHRALADVTDFGDIETVTDAITRQFLLWQVDPDNTRAPGRTCMTSLHNLRAGARWYDTDGAVESAGCGAVMRLVPTAFAPDPYWLGLTALQAGITHKHPRAVVPALLLADATRHAPEYRGRFLEHALTVAAQIYHGTSTWTTDPYLREVLAPITGDVSSYLVDGLDDGTADILTAATARLEQLRHLPPAEFGDPCVGIGEGWESASAVALALLVADLATTGNDAAAALTGPGALAWASTSNGDSDSIACIAGGLIGSAHPEHGYWAAMGLAPTFEPRYAEEILVAASQLPAGAQAD